jgi:NAD(P)H-flavin reductase
VTLKKNHLCRIISNERLSADTLRLTFAFGPGAGGVRPGQFAYVRCAGLDAYMRRPFGIGSADAAGGALTLFYQVKGRGTALLSRLGPGQELDVMVPLGNGFDLSAFEAPNSAAGGERRDGERQSGGSYAGERQYGEHQAGERQPGERHIGDGDAGKCQSAERQPGDGHICERNAGEHQAGVGRWAPPTAALIGGGTGIFPLLFLAQELKIRYGVRADAYLGFRGAGAVLLEDEFARCAGSLHIATDDGSAGAKGLATDPFLSRAWRYGMVFACGPEPMLKTVQRVCADRGLPAQISLEQRMGCGIGACLGCACKVMAVAECAEAGAGVDAEDVESDAGADADASVCADADAGAWAAEGAGAEAGSSAADGDSAVRYARFARSARYARVCKDGPVFWASEVIFDG